MSAGARMLRSMEGSTGYLLLKHSHVGLVAASGSLFALRGVAVLIGARWPMHAGVRTASVAIDTLLLAAGVSLFASMASIALTRHPAGLWCIVFV
jgi:uncharacterized membrane protein SirB2